MMNERREGETKKGGNNGCFQVRHSSFSFSSFDLKKILRMRRDRSEGRDGKRGGITMEMSAGVSYLVGSSHHSTCSCDCHLFLLPPEHVSGVWHLPTRLKGWKLSHYTPCLPIQKTIILDVLTKVTCSHESFMAKQ